MDHLCTAQRGAARHTERGSYVHGAAQQQREPLGSRVGEAPPPPPPPPPPNFCPALCFSVCRNKRPTMANIASAGAAAQRGRGCAGAVCACLGRAGRGGAQAGGGETSLMSARAKTLEMHRVCSRRLEARLTDCSRCQGWMRGCPARARVRGRGCACLGRAGRGGAQAGGGETSLMSARAKTLEMHRVCSRRLEARLTDCSRCQGWMRGCPARARVRGRGCACLGRAGRGGAQAGGGETSPSRAPRPARRARLGLGTGVCLRYRCALLADGPRWSRWTTVGHQLRETRCAREVLKRV